MPRIVTKRYINAQGEGITETIYIPSKIARNQGKSGALAHKTNRLVNNFNFPNDRNVHHFTYDPLRNRDLAKITRYNYLIMQINQLKSVTKNA